MEKRGGEGIGTLSFSMITFHRDGFQVLRKTFLDFKTGKRLGKIYISRENKKNLQVF